MTEAATVATEILAQMHTTSRMRMASEAPQPTSYQIIECYIQRLLDDKDRYHTAVTVEETLEIERLHIEVVRLNNQIINEQLKVTELKLQLADERRRCSS